MSPQIPVERPETPEERKKRLEPLIANRMKKREEWDAYWKINDYESRGHPLLRMRYYVWRCIDLPVTMWRENIIEPLQDKYGHLPYYHRRFNRVPTVDECHVNDKVCYHEAQMQYRMDKLVDSKILDILKLRRKDCLNFHNQNKTKCQHQMEDFEEAELNWYIKYGEMSRYGDVLTCYQKQKHRMIWERRNPEIMAERQKAYEEHKRLLNEGIYDHWFWKRGPIDMYKDYMATEFRRQTITPYTFKIRDEETISLDPEYYRKKVEDDGKTKTAKPWHVWP